MFDCGSYHERNSLFVAVLAKKPHVACPVLTESVIVAAHKSGYVVIAGQSVQKLASFGIFHFVGKRISDNLFRAALRVQHFTLAKVVNLLGDVFSVLLDGL